MSAAALTPDDFVPFFKAVHGVPPFPWQDRLFRVLAETGEWPQVLDLPTGTGKTAALDIALFHLALEAAHGPKRRAPIRIAFVVDRRIIVDDAFERTRKLQAALRSPKTSIVERAAAALRALSGEGEPPLLARRLRGGVPREDDWARSPNQPTILCSTVDQVGSRLLFRGYGISDRMKPVHAGLIGSDCLILLDEAHLSEPFRQTLEAVKRHREAFCDPQRSSPAPFQVAWLTATPGRADPDRFQLAQEDREHPVLRPRLSAPKPARLILAARQKDRSAAAADDERVSELAHAVDAALLHLATGQLRTQPVIAIVVNRVLRARRLFEALRKTHAIPREGEAPRATVSLIIGPAREADRAALGSRLEAIKTGRDDARAQLDRPAIVVATQTIEAGADLDFDALITEIASLDALKQRFGRLNRAGREFEPFAAIVAHPDDTRPGKPDPIYDQAAAATWEALIKLAEPGGKSGVVDFGISKVDGIPWIGEISNAGKDSRDLLAPKPDAPVVMPAYINLWSQTSPVPATDPEVGLFLHGPGRSPATVQIVWRADLRPEDLDGGSIPDGFEPKALFSAVLPRPAEAVEVSLAAARRWLRASLDAPVEADRQAADFADAPGRDDADGGAGNGRAALLWAGAENPRTGRVYAADLRPHDLIVVPAAYGGCDEFGWSPGSADPVRDVADEAAWRFAGRRYALRLSRRLIEAAAPVDDETGAATKRERVLQFAQNFDDLMTDLRDARLRRNAPSLIAALRDAGPPPPFEAALHNFTRLQGRARPQAIFPYGIDSEGRERGIVLLAPNGLAGLDAAAAHEGGTPATEDDTLGSIPGYRLSLEKHSAEVREWCTGFVKHAGIAPAIAADVVLAAYLHDWGKQDPRFQALLYGGDWFAVDDTVVLAKSDRRGPADAWKKSDLPDHWRHEALSVRLAIENPLIKEAHDPELVLWLVGVHHGYGRPFFPHVDREEPADDPGPQSLAFSFNGWDWAQIFERLTCRYGVWELARLEAVVRLADHRASEAAGRRAGEDNKS